MKYAVFTVMVPDWTPQEAAEKLAKLGYDGVEWRVTDPADPKLMERIPQEMHSQARYWLDNKCTIDPDTLPDAAPEIKQISETAGLEICALGTYLGCHQHLAVEKMMQAAQAMGCPRIRVNTPSYDRSQNYNDLFAEATDQYREIESLARTYNVAACIETHFGNITASAGLAHRFVSQFDPEYVGVIFDPGNMVYEGYETWRMGFEPLGPHLHEVHAKNAAWSPIDQLSSGAMAMAPKPSEQQKGDGTTLWSPHFSTIQGGFANWEQIMDDLDAVGYDGWIAFEDFSGHDEDPETKCARNLAYIKGYEN